MERRRGGETEEWKPAGCRNQKGWRMEGLKKRQRRREGREGWREEKEQIQEGRSRMIKDDGQKKKK